jgi:hypothetical protein
MKITITILQIHQNAQVEKEKDYEVKNGFITFTDGTKYKIEPYNILFRKNQPYGILLTGVGFTTINKIGKR